MNAHEPLRKRCLDPASFETACGYVESVTLEMAPSLAARFGGRLTFANRLTLAETSALNSATG